jgi:hypothetical protein
MDGATITTPGTFILEQGVTPVSGVVTYNGGTNTATFTPDAPLSESLVYTATVTTGAENSGGTPLALDNVWSFTTSAVTPPTVASTFPSDGDVEISINNQQSATFSTTMNGATILTPGTFILMDGLTPVSGTVSYNGGTNTATFIPDAPLGLNITYTATITTAAENAGGTPLATDFSWSFTTAACSQEPIVLGVAGDFAVLAGATVTNTGATSVTGDLGVSPGSSVTGFPPGILVGTLHVTDGTAAAGVFDLTVAYNDAAGRTLCPVSVAGNIGGQTLAPGLYKSTGSLEVSSGNLTLDAQGDENAIFIFQIASTFDMSSGLQMTLIGNAKASNIFWQVGSSATFNTNCHAEGTFMADQSISFSTGATLNGRALARIAAVNLDGNTIVKP